jgi:hypothetical protein
MAAIFLLATYVMMNFTKSLLLDMAFTGVGAAINFAFGELVKLLDQRKHTAKYCSNCET